MTRTLGFVFLLLAALVLAATGAQANLVSNPSFEENSTIVIGDYANQAAGSTNITGWAIDVSLDWIGTNNVAADGARSIDMNASPSFGEIKQTVSGLTPGTTYYVTFAMAGITDAVPLTKTMNVTIDGVVAYSAIYAATKTAATLLVSDWVDKTFTFVAPDGDVVLEFVSTSGGAAGPALDNVRMDVVPLPGAVLLLGAGMARLVAYARRKRD